MVDYSGLENRRAERHRGFESLSLRYQKELSNFAKLFFFALRGVSHPPVGGGLAPFPYASVSLRRRARIPLSPQRVQQMLDSFFVLNLKSATNSHAD